MTGEMKTSAVNFATTLKPAVSFACMVSDADELRKQIANGQIEGVSFPVPKDNKGRGAKFTKSREARTAKVEEINKLRRTGVKARDAAKQCGTTYATYRHWAVDLGIECHYSARWGDMNL